jgi:hypothetical protein
VREIRSGLYNKCHLIELSNVETVGLSHGHWEYLTMGLSDSQSVRQCPNVGQSECPTLGQSECPDIGQSDSLGVQYFQLV